MQIEPSKKRMTVEVNGEVFKTQKALIDRVKPMLNEYEIRKTENQTFILDFVKLYDKVISQKNKIKHVYYGPNEWSPKHFKSKCIHVVFQNDIDVSVGYKNVISSLFDPNAAYARRQRINQNHIYRDMIQPDIANFRAAMAKFGCKACGENFDFTTPIVDHCGSLEFRHIVKNYETEKETNFLKYHRENAVLQILCEPCHVKKAKRWWIKYKSTVNISI